jgi:hypothetical protein
MILSTKKLTAPLLVLLVALGATAAAPGEALASDFQLKPALGLSQEYNDNVNESVLNRRTDWITRVQPGVTFHYLLPDSSWDAGYNLDYLKFDRGTKGDELSHQGLFKGSSALLGNLLYLDLNDNLSRVSVDVARDVTSDSAFAQQTDQNLATVSPYLLWRYSDKGSLKTGYSYTDVRYWSVAGISGVDRHQQDATAALSQEILPLVSLSAQYTFSRVDSQVNSYDSHSASGGARYEYADGCSIFANLGYNWQSFIGGFRSNSFFWDAGVTHDFHFLIATLASKSSTNTNPQSVSSRLVPQAGGLLSLTPRTAVAKVDPQSISTKVTSHSVSLDRKLDRGALGLFGSYSRFADTLPGGIDRTTAALGASGSYELRPSLIASLSATGYRVTGFGPGDFPYHFTGVGALNYSFNHDLTAGVTYTHVMYRFKPEQNAGSLDVNRVVLNLVKAF